MIKSLAVAGFATVVSVALAPAASATIHPLVESVDCANATANEHHPLGDVAEVPGVTPDFGHHSDRSDLASLSATTKGFTDFDSPALLGHKLDGQCGRVGR